MHPIEATTLFSTQRCQKKSRLWFYCLPGSLSIKTVWDWQVSSVNNIFWKMAWLTLVWINSCIFTLTSTSSNYKIIHFSSLSPAIVEAKAHTFEGGRGSSSCYMCSREDSQTMTSKLSFTLENWMNSSVCAHQSLWVHFSSNSITTVAPVLKDDNLNTNDMTEQRCTFNTHTKKKISSFSIARFFSLSPFSSVHLWL